MSNIVTITFNPCIDKSTSVHALIPERKLYCSAPKHEPGGGGVNVARAIKKLGGEATAIFPSGGSTGRYFNHLLEKENVTSVIISANSETRENIIVLDEASGKQYRFDMPGLPLTDEEWQQCLDVVTVIKDAEYIIASGSLPPGVPLNIYAQLAKIAKTKKARFIVDASGESLKYAVDEGVYLLKPNLAELCSLVGKKSLQVDEIKEIAKGLCIEGKCEVIVVSMGAEGAMLVTNDIVELIPSPPVIKKSTVGAGDSMVAGIVYFLSKRKNLIEAVKYGVACGTAATMNPGTALCNKEDADALFKEITMSEKFLR